jgi:cytochrome c biogenesis protein CcdA
VGVLFGGAVLASFLAGVVALFAPCCISVMLPAYFASSFATRRALIVMTFVFAAGLGLIILPIALGAAAIGSAITAHHLIFYLAGGALMLALGLYVLVGGKLMLPMPAMRARRGSGPLAVLSLGAFSGVASSCCAPVLAGVAALSGASGSFSNALILGIAYVFGMVFPLFVIALLWDRFDWGESRLLKGKRFSVPVFGRRLGVHSTALASGLILIAMGVVVIVIAFRGNAMPSSGWQVSLSAHVQHYAHLIKVWAGTLPGWITAIGIFAALAALGWRALGQVGVSGNGDAADERDEPARRGMSPRTKPTVQTEEMTLER